MFIEKYELVAREIFDIEEQSKAKRIAWGLQLLDDRKFSVDGIRANPGAVEEMIREMAMKDIMLTAKQIYYCLELARDNKKERNNSDEPEPIINIPSSLGDDDAPAPPDWTPPPRPTPPPEPPYIPPGIVQPVEAPRTELEESITPKAQPKPRSSYAQKLKQLKEMYEYTAELWPDYWLLPEISLAALRKKVEAKTEQAKKHVKDGKVEMKMVDDLSAAVGGDEEKSVGEALRKMMETEATA